MRVMVLPNLTSLLPQREVPGGDWPHLKSIKLADPSYLVISQIDFILKAEVYSAVVLNETQCGTIYTPSTHNTSVDFFSDLRISTRIN